MATLKGIVENIAFSFGQQFNETLRRSIADSVIEVRAMLIRRDLERNPMSYSHYLDGITLELIKADRSADPAFPIDRILATKEPVPKPVRLKGNGRTDYRYVGSIDRITPYVFATWEEANYYCKLDFQNNVTYYTISGNHIYLLNRAKQKTMYLEGIFEDPRQIIDCNYPDKHPDEVEFACPADMINTIKDEIKRKYFPQLIDDGKEVNINEESNAQN